MKDLEIDLKLIFVVICISTILGTLLWVGYNIYIEITKDENETIKNFEGDMTSNISSNNKAEFNISDIIGEEKAFEINNNNAISLKEGWVKRTYKYKGTGYQAIYHIPNDWRNTAGQDKKNGVTIDVKMLELDDLTKETTYEEFLNKFIETKENKELLPQDVENYSKRTININGETFYVLIEEEYYNAIYEYFCLKKDNYVYYLQVLTSKDKYNKELIDDINEIFATFRIY